MKKIKIEKTDINQNMVKREGKADDKATYVDLLEYTLDTIPSGGFAPKDIRERNRIQDAIDKAKEGTISFEDADFENLKKIVSNSRWNMRNKELSVFLEIFEKK